MLKENMAEADKTKGEGTVNKKGTKHRRFTFVHMIAFLFVFIFIILLGLLLINRAHAGLAADFNGDGVVNSLDRSILQSHWGSTAVNQSTGDANNDAKANIYDLAILANEWGQGSQSGTVINVPSGASETTINNDIAQAKSDGAGTTLVFASGKYCLSDHFRRSGWHQY